MGQHGGTAIGLRTESPLHTPTFASSGKACPRGFRHYVLSDRDSPEAADTTDLSARAARLEQRMTAALNWSEAPRDLRDAGDYISKSQPDEHDNPYMPSGYTYLCQFIAHDMVSTRVPFWATDNLSEQTSNDRTTRLRLDSLYGGGPAEMPIIYVPADPNDLSRGKLQLGRAGPIQTPTGETICPFRDIARLKLSNTLMDLPGLTEALVADQRNDDHAIISQLTMLFCHLHNIFIDLQEKVSADDPAFGFTRDTIRVFENAREATTLIFRHVIRQDVLRRLLHPDVYTLYAKGSPSFLDVRDGADPADMPLEFSHAAFRFGHAMVRESYQINAGTPSTGRPLQDALNRFSSARNIHMQPMLASWVVQWSNFFNMPGVTNLDRINLSRRIGPRAPLSLYGQGFGAIDASVGRGIFYRDLISAELANLWQVDDLLNAMQKSPELAAIVGKSSLLRDGNWRRKIAGWLPDGVYPAGTTDPWGDVPLAVKQADIEMISSRPPLPFFVLFEAWMDPESQGCRLGPFGSILVAETLFAALNDKLQVEQQSESLSQQLATLNPRFKDKAFDQDMTMAAVIEFIDRRLQASSDLAMKFPSLL